MQTSIIDVFARIVRKLSGNTPVSMMAYNGECYECKPDITYIFGDSQYIKDQLDEYSKGAGVDKLPLIALFTPVKERRGLQDIASESKVSMIIACSSRKEWTNEERKQYSFENVLRPIYEAFLASLDADYEVVREYNESRPHTYSENYSYGRYGAYTSNGDEVSEPIDAINISDLQISIKYKTCTR